MRSAIVQANPAMKKQISAMIMTFSFLTRPFANLRKGFNRLHADPSVIVTAPRFHFKEGGHEIGLFGLQLFQFISFGGCH